MPNDPCMGDARALDNLVGEIEMQRVILEQMV
jgi:hypothetical protein